VTRRNAPQAPLGNQIVRHIHVPDAASQDIMSSSGSHAHINSRHPQSRQGPAHGCAGRTTIIMDVLDEP